MRMNCSDLRYLNANNNKAYIAQIQKWTNEIASIYGTRVDYFQYDYSLGRHDYLYGEDRPAPYLEPKSMIIIANVNSDSIMLSKFGLNTTAEVVAYIPFSTFAEAMGNPLARPKAGDLIRLTEFGISRPLGPGGYPYYGIDVPEDSGNSDFPVKKDCLASLTTTGRCKIPENIDSLTCCRDLNNDPNGINDSPNEYDDIMKKISGSAAPFGPKIYEITEVKDEDLTNGLNAMLGHYCWRIEAIRFDNSYQPNAPVENGSDMVNDAPYYGKLPFGTETPENTKQYPQISDKEEDRFWDHTKYNLDEVYGGYGYKPKDGLTSNVKYEPSMDPYSKEYSVIFDSLLFYDLNEIQVGNAKFYNLEAEDNAIKLSEATTMYSNPKAKYYIRDSSECIDPNKLVVYAIFVYDGAIGVQYVGDLVYTNDIIYTSIYMHNKKTRINEKDTIAKLYIVDGALTLLADAKTPVMQKEEAVDTNVEEEEANNNSNEDIRSKFGEEIQNPIDAIYGLH